MKRIVVLGVLILLTTLSFAQNDKKAEQILEKVSTTYKGYNSFRIKFSLTIENKEEDIKETSIGSADIKGNKYKICLMGADTYFDGTTRYSYLKDSKEVNISEPDEDEESLSNPAKIFDLYKEGFTYRIIETKKEKGVDISIIKLTPTSNETEYKEVLLKVETKTSNVISLTSIGKEGNDLIIKMTKLETTHNFKDSYFTFDTKSNPEVEVVDMR